MTAPWRIERAAVDAGGWVAMHRPTGTGAVLETHEKALQFMDRWETRWARRLDLELAAPAWGIQLVDRRKPEQPSTPATGKRAYRKRLTPEQVEGMRRMRAEGVSVRDIAAKYGASSATVSYQTRSVRA